MLHNASKCFIMLPHASQCFKSFTMLIASSQCYASQCFKMIYHASKCRMLQNASMFQNASKWFNCLNMFHNSSNCFTILLNCSTMLHNASKCFTMRQISYMNIFPSYLFPAFPINSFLLTPSHATI